MADVTARLTGSPGACHSTFGPGATNISTGVGGALLDRSPVIVFTSEMNDQMLGRTTQMNISHQKLFEPLTKSTFRINPVNAAQVIESAIEICRKEYPGPVHIGLPSDVAGKEFVDTAESPQSGATQKTENDITGIEMLLKSSRKPVLAIGLTAARFCLSDKILSFLSEYKMPVVVTPMAKGLIPEDHHCYAGELFHALSDYLEDVHAECDLVIGLGYDPVEFNYESWIPEVPVLHFNTSPTEELSKGELTQFISEPDRWFDILRKMNSGATDFDPVLIENVKSEMLSVFSGFTNHFGPAAALKILQEELPENVILTADVGSHLHLTGQFWQCKGRQNLIITNGWSGMGFGLPAALAAQINKRDATVVCITGDGGFLMMAGEMITARRYNLPVITVVFSDGELNLIKVKQSWKNLPLYATQLYHGDLFGSDTFLGVKVITASSSEMMKKAVIEALSVNEPVIINAVIEPEDYNWLVVKRL